MNRCVDGSYILISETTSITPTTECLRWNLISNLNYISRTRALFHFCCVTYIVSHHSSREHRVLTKFCHVTRFLASTLTSFYVLPWCLISSRIVLRHVVWGLVPWGFHSRAAFAMSPGGRRSVWPSHPHFLCRISNSIGLCLALAHSPWFDIWTGQNIFSILRMHLLTRTCSWCMMVQVAQA